MSELIQQVTTLLQPILEGTDMFVTEIKIKPTNNIKVFIDADTGFSIQKSAMVNRKLYAAIEEQQIFPEGDFSLEVSSPGVEEPLKQPRQFIKNLGRDIAVTLTDETQKPIKGKLTKADDQAITIAVTDKKKKEVSEYVIHYALINTAIIQISFK